MKTSRSIIALLMAAFLILSCSQRQFDAPYFQKDEAAAIQSGGVRIIPIETPKGKFRVWTKRFGNNPRIRLLLLHGGPGSTHEYFECFESFLPQEQIEFIYYDQLGSAFSDQPKDKDLWRVDRFVEEVEQVRKGLGLDSTNFYLLGHSWGGILAMEYALKYQQNLKGLIISNMMASAPEYDAYADNVLAKQMDPDILKEVRSLEAKKQFANPRYMEILMEHFYTKHILRRNLEDWPDPVNRGFARINQELYVTMQGPSEFGLSGRLEQWDRKADLKNIAVPTLVIGAQYDTMDPEHMQWMSTQVQNGSYLYCPDGSHLDMYDDQERYLAGLIRFLKETDAGANAVQF